MHRNWRVTKLYKLISLNSCSISTLDFVIRVIVISSLLDIAFLSKTTYIQYISYTLTGY